MKRFEWSRCGLVQDPNAQLFDTELLDLMVRSDTVMLRTGPLWPGDTLPRVLEGADCIVISELRSEAEEVRVLDWSDMPLEWADSFGEPSPPRVVSVKVV